MHARRRCGDAGTGLAAALVASLILLLAAQAWQRIGEGRNRNATQAMLLETAGKQDHAQQWGEERGE